MTFLPRRLSQGVAKIALMACLLSAAPGGAADANVEARRFVELVEAARLGDVAGVERALAAGAEIDRTGGDAARGERFPALVHALEAGRDETALLLIGRGADVASRPEGRAVFAWAAGFGRTAVAREIWARLPDAERRRLLAENDSWLRATENGHLETVRELERMGFSLAGKDRGAPALFAAVGSGRMEMLEHVLARNTPANGAVDGVTALARAAGRGRVDMVARLLDAGADVEATSKRVPDAHARLEFGVTPLTVAVIKAEPEVAELLLRRGANPAALDNLAIRWADLAGDEACFRLLKNAGAPEPAPFSFLEWLGESREKTKNPDAGGDAEAGFAGLLAGAPLDADAESAVFTRPIRLAVVPLSPGLGDAEALLAARLSGRGGASLVERSEIHRIARERRLALGFGGAPAENRGLGELLGADALVLLRMDEGGGRKILETRVVGVASGLVTSVEFAPWDKPEPESWAEAVARRCAADSERVFTSPQEARLVAVTPLVASTSGSAARETERRLTRLLAARLARLPGVFLLERDELERLRAEPGALDETLLKSSWIVEGSVEVMGAQNGNPATNTLTLRLFPGSGAPIELRVAGAAADSLALTEVAVKRIAEATALRTDEAWEPTREAELYFVRAGAFGERAMWTEAQAAAEIASALGLRGDEITRAWVDWSARRVLRPFEVIDGDIYGNPKPPPTWAELVAERAPLPGPRRGDDDWTLGNYLDQAERLADGLARGLGRREPVFGGGDYEAWLAGPAWEAATLPLRLGEALSYRREYGTELDALRERLLALNTEALATAKAGGFRAAYHTLLGLRCRLLPWWQPNEAIFQAEMLRVLHLAREDRPAAAGHPVWGSVFRSGHARIGADCGATSRRWTRLARRLVESADEEERFLGLAWLGGERHAGRGVVTEPFLRDAFSSLLEKDRAWTGPIWEFAHDARKYPVARSASDAPPWYGTAFRAATGRAWAGGWSEKRWDAGAAGARLLPEAQAFELVSFERKAALMKEHGAACLLWHFGVGGVMPDEHLLRLLEAVRQTAPVLAAARREHSEARNYFMDPARWMSRFRRELADNAAKRRMAETPPLKFERPRWLFPGGSGEPGTETAGRACTMEYHGYQTGSDVWWLARGTGRVLLFRFGADGLPAETVVHPAREDGAYYWIGDAWHRSASGGGDVSERHIALQARDARRRQPSRFNDCVRLYDRVEERWTTLQPPFPVNQIFDVRIVSGRVYYSFLHNGEIEREASPLEADFVRRGEPLWGIGEYEIATARHRLLVSSRRTPAGTPLDEGGVEYRELCAVSPHALAAVARPQWVFDIAADAWRRSTPAEQGLARKGRGQALEIEAGGDLWVVVGASGKKILFRRKSLNSGKRPVMVSIPVTIETGAGMEAEDEAEIDPKLAKRIAEVPHFNFHGTPHGVALSGRDFYAWTPIERVRPVLEESIRRAGK